MITWWTLMMTRGILEMMKMMMMKKRVKSCFCSFCFFFRICCDSSLKHLFLQSYNCSTNVFNYFTKLSLLTEIMGLLSGFSISTLTISFSFLLEKFLLKCSLIKYLHLIIIAKNLIFQIFLKIFGDTVKPGYHNNGLPNNRHPE